MKVRGSIYGTGKRLPGDREKFGDHESRFKGLSTPQFISHKRIDPDGSITRTITIGAFYKESTMGGHAAGTPYLPPLRMIRVTEGPGAGEIEVECYMDSGFLGVPDYNRTDPNTITPLTLYQSPRLLSLYPLTAGKAIYQPQPGDVVHGAYPPSFDFLSNPPGPGEQDSLFSKVEGSMTVTKKAGNNTGKLKLLTQAKLALKLYVPALPLPPINSIAPSLSTMGLYTEEAGVYWYVTITNGTEVTFTLLNISSAWVAEVKSTPYGSARLVAEAHALACSSVTTTTRTVEITGTDLPDGMPLAYSWKGNWSGNRFAIVLHEYTGSDNDIEPGNPECNVMSIHTSLVTLEINKSAGDFSVTRAVEEEHDWLFKDGELIWYPVPGQELMCHVVAACGLGALTTTETAEAVPLLCWYGAEGASYENNTLVIDRHTREYEESHNETSNPCPGLINGSFYFCNETIARTKRVITSGTRGIIEIEIGGELAVHTETPQYKNVFRSVGVDADGLTWSGPTAVAGGQDVQLSQCQISGEVCDVVDTELVETPGVSTSLDQWDYGGTVSFVEEWGNVVIAGSGAAHVIPYDCAEGVIVVSADVDTGNLTHRTGNRTNATWIRQIGDIRWYDGVDWHYQGNYRAQSGYQIGNPGISGLVTTYPNVKNVDGTLRYYGRYYVDPMEEGVSHRVIDGVPEGDNDGTAEWLRFNKSDACRDLIPYMIQGIGPEIAAQAGYERQWGEGYPDDAAEANETGVIGFG